MIFSWLHTQNKAVSPQLRKILGHIGLWFILLVIFIPQSGNAVEIFSPTGLGLAAVFPRQDTDQIGQSGLGSGLIFSINYREESRSFLNLGTGFYLISDDVLKMDHFQTTVFPTFEVQYGKYLGKSRFWHPNLYLGVNVYAAFDKIRIDTKSTVSERFFQSSAFAGCGLEYQPNFMYSIHISTDYRYVFMASEHSERRYLMFGLGFLFYQ
jgi:hypothetical protein